MSNTWTATVPLVKDGLDPVSGSTMNPIISTLTSRDQYLFDRIDSYEDKSVLLAYNIAVDPSVNVWDVVYFNAAPGTQLLQKAVCSYANSADPTHLVPAASAYVFGMVQSINSGVATVYIRGLISAVPLTGANTILDATSAALLADNPTQNYGPLYLSFDTPGKLSFTPTGASVFVGYYMGTTDGITGNFFLAPNIDSLNQLYFNYKMYLHAAVAGTATKVGSVWNITSSDFTKTGWVDETAANTQYGYAIPTGAQYFYNIPLTSIILADGTLSAQQKKDALLLREALPPYPAAYTMLFNNGVLQTPYDTDHTSGAYVITGDGIWWCNNTDGNTPWQTGSWPAVNLLLQTTKLNPFYKASVVSSLAPYIATGTNDTSQAITLVDKLTGATSSTGDLLLKLNLPVTTTSTTAGAPAAVKSVSFAPVSGALSVTTGPVISGIVAGPGINVSTPDYTTGLVTVSMSNYTLSGDVDNLEPEESDFVYKGLHSYLRMKNPSTNQRVGFVGKIQLPQVLPTGKSFKVKLLAFGEASATNTPVLFNFEYAISGVDPLGGQITSTIYKGSYNSSTTISISGFVQNIVRLVAYDSSSLPYFEIPAASLVANAYANFRVVRVNSTYTGNIDVLGVTWAIE